jgi:hypothetical protein
LLILRVHLLLLLAPDSGSSSESDDDHDIRALRLSESP